jgi:hypothetical protein
MTIGCGISHRNTTHVYMNECAVRQVTVVVLIPEAIEY